MRDDEGWAKLAS